MVFFTSKEHSLKIRRRTKWPLVQSLREADLSHLHLCLRCAGPTPWVYQQDLKSLVRPLPGHFVVHFVWNLEKIKSPPWARFRVFTDRGRNCTLSRLRRRGLQIARLWWRSRTAKKLVLPSKRPNAKKPIANPGQPSSCAI